MKAELQNFSSLLKKRRSLLPPFASVGDGQPMGARVLGHRQPLAPLLTGSLSAFPALPFTGHFFLEAHVWTQSQLSWVGAYGCPTPHQLLSRDRCSHGVPCVLVTWKEPIAGSHPQTCAVSRVSRHVCTFTPCRVPTHTAMVHLELGEPQQTFQVSAFLLSSH